MPAFDNAHALVIGIARYQHVSPLPKVRDAAEVARALADPARCGYPAGNVRILEDEDATLDNLNAALADLARRADAESSVFVYFSGHGGSAGGSQYLLPVGALYPGDDELKQSALSDREFSAALEAISARKKLVVLDCCHAGGLARSKDLAPPPPKPPPLTDFDKLRGGDGRVVLASSRANELSWVPPGSEFGLFTRHLLDGLNGGAASDDGFVRVFDLFSYVQPKVTEKQPDQRPYFTGEVGSNFPVALYQGGRIGSIPRVDETFRYDAYVSFADRPPDDDWVWNTFLPRLRNAGLRVAVSDDVLVPGVDRVVGVERAIRESRRTVVVLSNAYLKDRAARFVDVLAQSMGIDEGTYRLLPVYRESLDGESRVPQRLSQLVGIHLERPPRVEQQYARLIAALKDPLPKYGDYR